MFSHLLAEGLPPPSRCPLTLPVSLRFSISFLVLPSPSGSSIADEAQHQLLCFQKVELRNLQRLLAPLGGLPPSLRPRRSLLTVSPCRGRLARAGRAASGQYIGVHVSRGQPGTKGRH